MNRNLHRQLLRPGRFFLGFIACVFYTGLLAGAMRGQHQLGAGVFQWFCLSLPLAFGAVFATTVHEPMHRPFALLLPHAGRRFFWSHAIVVGAFALVLSLIACRADRTLPFFAATAVATAGLTLALPLEPGWRWAGSRGLFALALVAAISALAFSGDVKAFVIAHPWLGGAGAVALTAASFTATFSPPRRRARAQVPHTAFLSTLWSPENMKRRATEALVRQKASRVRWRRSFQRDSLAHWVSIVLHETFGRSRLGMTGTFAIAPLGFLLMIWVIGSVLGQGFVERIYETIGGAVTTGGRSSSSLPWMVVLIGFPHWLGLPRPEWLYPISRARRAQVSFAASLWQLAVGFAIVIGGLILTSWLASLWFGREFDFHAAARFAAQFAGLVALVPLVQWGRLHENVRKDRAMAMLCLLLACLTAAAAAGIVKAAGVDLASAGFLTTCAVAIVASQAIYYAALRRFYRKGDLLQHGTKRQNFSLI